MQGVDENDPEVQRRIYQELKRKRLQEQLQSIEEHQPELLYGHVHMLYVSMEINDRPVKAFVDSGAQSTIMGIHYAR